MSLARKLGRIPVTAAFRSIPAVTRSPRHLQLAQTAAAPAAASPFSTSSTARHASVFQPTTPATMPATAETASYRFNHTMIRVKDPERSVKFYTEIMGMDLVDEKDAGDFKLFFLAYSKFDGVQKDFSNRGSVEGLLELTWNKGTEKDANFSYHNGNDQPQGFGHTCIAVDDLDKACQRFEKLGVEFKKRPTDGKMRNIAFIYDPDHYWIEIIAHGQSQ